MTPPIWTDSTDKHGVARGDAINAILNATYTEVLHDVQPPTGRVVLYIGPRHPQALPDDEIEVLVHEHPDTGEEARIFHVMPLGPKFRTYRQENPQ